MGNQSSVVDSAGRDADIIGLLSCFVAIANIYSIYFEVIAINSPCLRVHLQFLAPRISFYILHYLREF